MALMDYIHSAFDKIGSSKRGGLPAPVSGGQGMGMAEYDDMILSKPAIIFHIGQTFFNFLAMCCMAGVASFQAKHGVGPSGLSGFAIFVSVLGVIVPLFLLLIPVVDVRYGKFTRLSRALMEVRVGFILTGGGVAVSLLIAFIVTISAFTQPGCKNPDNDPNADKGDDFKNGLPGWCTTKKAAAIFFWLAFGFWTASLVLNILNWRRNRNTRPRDPPFRPPVSSAAPGADRYGEEEEEDYESTYEHVPPVGNAGAGGYRDPYRDNETSSPFADSNAAGRNSGNYNNYGGGGTSPSGYNSNSSYVLPPVGSGVSSPPHAAGRQSMDAYGAFSDPAPSGFGAASGLNTPSNGPSRTMQYASDPYAAVSATLANAPAASGPPPPGYDYSAGYR